MMTSSLSEDRVNLYTPVEDEDDTQVAVTAPQFRILPQLMSYRTILTLALLSLIYVIIGGVAFSQIETTREDQVRQNTAKLMSTFLAENTCIDHEDFKALLSEVAVALKYDINPLNATSEKHRRWTYLNSMFFSTSVVTTIGYGNFAPQTDAGRGFCAFYALWGIPLFMTPIAGLGDRLNKCTRKIFARTKLGRKRPKVAEALRSILTFFCGLLVLIVLPGVLFSNIEGWSLPDAIYYGFITFSTIGFGDFVAGYNPEVSYPFWYRPFRIVWLLLGLAWVSLVVGLKVDVLAGICHKRASRKNNCIAKETSDSDPMESESGYKSATTEINISHTDSCQPTVSPTTPVPSNTERDALLEYSRPTSAYS